MFAAELRFASAQVLNFADVLRDLTSAGLKL
jgi:hypothetical protein